MHKVEVVLGDSSLPPGPISGGSWATASLTPAVLEAARNASKAIVLAATKAPDSPFKGKQERDLEFADGRVRAKGQAGTTLSAVDVLKLAKAEAVNGKGRSQGVFGDKDPKYSFHSFGAQFAEVTWQPETARLRVSRTVTVIDAGRMINPRTARNQIEGEW